MTAQSKGFTLIELLIAISIIAIMSTIGLIAYSKAQSISRDARRKQDLLNIRQALELYRERNKAYPITAWVGSHNAETWIPSLDSTYISSLPKDPRQASELCYPWTADCYNFVYMSDDYCQVPAGESYFLMARTENPIVPTPETTYYANNSSNPDCANSQDSNVLIYTSP